MSIERDHAAFQAWITPRLRGGSHLIRSATNGAYMDNRVAAKWPAFQAGLEAERERLLRVFASRHRRKRSGER